MAYTTASLYHSGGAAVLAGGGRSRRRRGRGDHGADLAGGLLEGGDAHGRIRLEGVAGGGGGSFPRRRAVAHRERDARLGIGQRREDQSAVGAILPRIAVDPLVLHLGSALDGDNVAVLHAGSGVPRAERGVAAHHPRVGVALQLKLQVDRVASDRHARGGRSTRGSDGRANRDCARGARREREHVVCGARASLTRMLVARSSRRLNVRRAKSRTITTEIVITTVRGPPPGHERIRSPPAAARFLATENRNFRPTQHAAAKCLPCTPT